MTRRIPLAEPNIGPDEIELVTKVLQSGTIALGPYAAEFERLLAAHAGRAYAVACSSGTAGLHMAVRALGIGDGDEVITSPFSFVASANCLLYERAVPRFVDIEEESLGMDPGLVADAATVRTRAILPVHVFGNRCAITDLSAIAGARGWHLVEDACEALGTTVAGRPLGSFGDLSVFAFYPNKQITTGEGGVVLTDDPELAEVIRSLRNQGRDQDGTWLRHVRLGFNYRLDELSAALGVVQMRRREELAAGRARVAARYHDRLTGVDGLTLPRAMPDTQVDWFVYVVRFAGGIDRNRVMDDLAADGIPTRPYFNPIHLQPLYREFGYREGDFPVTERVAASTLAIPFSSRLPDADIDYVAERLTRAIHGP
ncbi:MAG TPA: DegT/DnrJ/EryC1/StrS family aminotransferase [Candidatus Limnocylindrales bacterium]|nr:DegT/DnrJ/EryC1/StrS family aminotransferase [Candidatus Limnocylindrales bacterium]